MPPKAVFDVQKAADLHAGGMPLAQVARLPGMPSQAVIKRRLEEEGHETWTGPWKLRSLTKERLYELHHVQNLNSAAIAKILDCGATTVRRKAIEFGIAKGSGKAVRPRGELHFNWRGGRHLTPQGYVMVRMPDHPNAGHNGYVLEHRLVASEALGRPLLKSEEVHHIDGNKLNNAPENLIVVPKGKHQKLHAHICRELWALRKEVARLSGQDKCNPVPAVPRHCVDWKVVG